MCPLVSKKGQILQQGELGPTFTDTLGAAFRQNNIVGSLLSGSQAPDVEAFSIGNELYGAEDPVYDPFANEGEDISGGYDPMLFVRANSKAEVDAIKNNVDMEKRDKDILSKSTTLKSLAANLVAGTFDPTILLPFATVTKGAGILTNFAKAAAATSGAIGVQEAGLQATQQTRTAEETIENMAAGALLGGALGSALGKLGAKKANAIKEVIKSELGGSGSRVPTYVESLTNPLIDGNIGAAKVDLSKGSELAAALGMDKIAGRLPLVRTSTLKSGKANLFFERLLENPLMRQKNLEGKASELAAETVAKLAEGDKAFVSMTIKDAFVKHKTSANAQQRLNYSDFKTELYRAMYKGDVSDVKEVSDVIKTLRSGTLDKWRDELINAKLLSPEQVSRTDATYIPRKIVKNKVLANPNGFISAIVDGMTALKQNEIARLTSLGGGADEKASKRLLELAEIGEDEMLGTARNLLNDITNDAGAGVYRWAGDINALPSMTKSRMPIPTDYIEEFINTDAEDVLIRFINESSGKAAVAKRFGDLNATISKQEIVQEYDNMIRDAVADPKLARKLQNEKAQVLSDMDYYIAAVSGQPITNTTHDTAVRFGRAIRQVNSMRMLGNVVLSSLVEPVRVIVANGMLRTLSNLPDVFRSLSAAINKAPAKDLERIGIGLDGFLNSRISEMQMIDNPIGTNTKLERGIDYAQKKFFSAVGLNLWTDWEKNLSATLFSKDLIEAGTKILNGGTVSKNKMAEFASMGLDADALRLAAEEYSKYGDLSDMSLFLNTDAWEQKWVAGAVLGAIKKSTDSYVVSRKAASIPRILSDTEVGKIFGQFMGYSATATTDVLYKSAQKLAHGDLRGASMLSLMTLMGVAQYMIKTKLSGGEISTDPSELLYAGFDQGGAFGLAPNIIGKMDSMTGNAISDAFGLKNVKYRQQDVLGAIAGPTGDTISKGAKIATDVIRGNVTDKTINNIRKLIPFQNWIAVRNVFDKLEEGVVESTGVRKTKKNK